MSCRLFRSDDHVFLERIREGIVAASPTASVSVLALPPVLGAALLGLDLLGATPAAGARLRAAFAALEADGEGHRPGLAAPILRR